MTISLIAAMSENRVIGRGGTIPWRLPDDLRFFMKKTTGHAVIMGRRTHESLDGALPRRRVIVLTRRGAPGGPGGRGPAGAETAPSLETALALAAADAEVFIAGGEEVYRAALPRADRIYLTLVHAVVNGDTFFPEFDEGSWRLVEAIEHAADERHAHAFTFQTWERRR